jgi:hypothetical protein
MDILAIEIGYFFSPLLDEKAILFRTELEGPLQVAKALPGFSRPEVDFQSPYVLWSNQWKGGEGIKT